MIVSLLCRSRGDHVAATSELSLRGATGNPDGLAETAASSSVDRRDDAHVLGQHAMTGIGSRQQRNDLDNAFFSNLHRLPAVRSPHNDVGEIGWIEQSVRAFDEDGPDLLDETIEVENVHQIEPALKRGPEVGVGDLLRLELFPTARMDEDRVGKIDLAIGEGSIKLVPNEKSEAENEKRRAAIRANKIRNKVLVQIQLRVEGEGCFGAELHHAQHAAAAGGKVRRLDDVLRVDREERQSAAAEDGTKRRHQRFRLTSRRLIVDDDAARSLSGGAARSHDYCGKRSALQFHFLEQADRQIGNLGN